MGCDAQLAFGGLSEGKCSGSSGNFSGGLIVSLENAQARSCEEGMSGEFYGGFSRGIFAWNIRKELSVVNWW